MLETVSGLKVCGVLLYNGSFEDVYADKYGACLFDANDGTAWYITEVNIGEPLELRSTNGLVDNINAGMYGADCIGVVYANNGNIVVFKEGNRAVLRDLGDMIHDKAADFYFSTDEEFDPEEYEEEE